VFKPVEMIIATPRRFLNIGSIAKNDRLNDQIALGAALHSLKESENQVTGMAEDPGS
jgi:hypothetical protein